MAASARGHAYNQKFAHFLNRLYKIVLHYKMYIAYHSSTTVMHEHF